MLIVEDDVDSARSTAYLVNEMGHRAEYAINGYAALSIATTFQPEIVLLDLGLPGLDGFEVCRRLKKDPLLMHFVKPVSAKLLEQLLE